MFAIIKLFFYGDVAQLARAHGSYPWCREFESPRRYHICVSKSCKSRLFFILQGIVLILLHQNVNVFLVKLCLLLHKTRSKTRPTKT